MFLSFPDGYSIVVYIYSDGAEICREEMPAVGVGQGEVTATVFSLEYLTAGEVIDIRIFQGSVGNKTMEGGREVTFCQINRLS